ALPRVHPVRPLPLGLALCRCVGCRRDRLRRRPLRGGDAVVHGADAEPARLRPLLLRRRCAHLHGRRRRVALRGADDRDECPLRPRPRRAPHAHRRRRPHRPQPHAGATRDGGRACRRLRRPQPAPAPPPAARRPGRRNDARGAAPARADEPRHRSDHDPRCTAREARCGRRRVLPGRSDLPFRPARDRSRAARRPRQHRGMTETASAVTTRVAGSEPPARSMAAKVFAILPAVGIAFAALTFYFVEAWTRKTPWVFTDELEWTQISRAIATTGHAARRGQPIFFKSLYAYVIAPCWWIHSTATAYAAVKYVNAVVMSLAAVPTYLLARMFVSRPASVVVAVLSIAIPGMSYATAIVPEVLAYPWYALCSYLIVRCLARRGRLDYVLASGACVVAGLIRWPQFATVPAAFLIALGALWVTGPRGRAWRSGWSRSDHFAAIVLGVGALILFNRVILQHEQIWQVSTQYWKNRMVDLGLKAGLSFVVGMGILPVVGGLASLHLPERRSDARYRAFVAYFAASIICLALYTAVKAAYLSTIFATLTEERNLIYLSPLMLLGTAMVFE